MYCVISPKNDIVRGFISEDDLKNITTESDLLKIKTIFQEEPFSPEKLKPFMAEILSFTAKRGHTYPYFIRATRIDYDCSLREITEKYHGKDDIYGNHEKDKYMPPAFKALPPISRRDVESLYRLTDSNPYNWPDRSNITIHSMIENAVGEPEFIRDKYVTFLKCILIPEDTIRKLGRAMVDADQVIERAVSFLSIRQEKLEDLLVTIPEFRKLILENENEILDDIVRSFQLYNAQVEKEYNMTISIDQVGKRFRGVIDHLDPFSSSYFLGESTSRENRFFSVDNHIKIKKNQRCSLIDNKKNDDYIVVYLFLQRNLDFYTGMIQNDSSFFTWASSTLHRNEFRLNETSDIFSIIMDLLINDRNADAIVFLQQNSELLNVLKENHIPYEEMITKWRLEHFVEQNNKMKM